MSAKKLIDYLPKDKPVLENQLVQAKIDAELWVRVNALRKREGLSWRDLIEAGLRKFMDEVK